MRRNMMIEKWDVNIMINNNKKKKKVIGSRQTRVNKGYIVKYLLILAKQHFTNYQLPITNYF